MAALYRIDLNHLTLREITSATPWFLLPFLLVCRLLRIRLTCFADEPPVSSLSAFEVEEADLPPEFFDRSGHLKEELRAAGFADPIYHAISLAHHCTLIYLATFAHRAGRAVAILRCRVWSIRNYHKERLDVVFLSELDDGWFLVSSPNMSDDTVSVPSIEVQCRDGATATELWQSHECVLDEDLPREPRRVHARDEVRSLVERHHARVRDFHLGRGFWQPLTEAEQEKLAAAAKQPLPTLSAKSQEDQVIAELERMQHKKTSWGNFFLVFGVSLALFIGAGKLEGYWDILYFLVPILLFHELGHYVAMRLFGYRNLRMFFIPFLGAAVAGQHYNVPGWKKAVVALAGPLPGIIVGVGLTLAGREYRQLEVLGAGVMLLAVNGLNLLPFLPLDGGWVVHAVLFCRRPALDLAFRWAAIVFLVVLGYRVSSLFYWLGGSLLIGMSTTRRMVEVAHRLRQRGDLPMPADDDTIPPEATRLILAELLAPKPKFETPRTLALKVRQVFGDLNARPPGVAASIALLAVHGVSLLICGLIVWVFFFGDIMRG